MLVSARPFSFSLHMMCWFEQRIGRWGSHQPMGKHSSTSTNMRIGYAGTLNRLALGMDTPSVLLMTACSGRVLLTLFSNRHLHTLYIGRVFPGASALPTLHGMACPVDTFVCQYSAPVDAPTSLSILSFCDLSSVSLHAGNVRLAGVNISGSVNCSMAAGMLLAPTEVFACTVRR